MEESNEIEISLNTSMEINKKSTDSDTSDSSQGIKDDSSAAVVANGDAEESKEENNDGNGNDSRNDNNDDVSNIVIKDDPDKFVDEIFEEKSPKSQNGHDETITQRKEKTNSQNTLRSAPSSNNPNIIQKYAISMANRPKTHLLVSLIISISLSAIGMIFGNFSVSVDNAGWNSRGTVISDRETQGRLIRWKQDLLFEDYEDGDVWKDLKEKTQGRWVDENEEDRGRRLEMKDSEEGGLGGSGGFTFEDLRKMSLPFDKNFPFVERPTLFHNQRILQENQTECGTDWFTSGGTKLMAMWKIDKTTSALSPSILKQICIAESNTQRELENNNLCSSCPTSSATCSPPYSLISLLRSYLTNDYNENGFDLTCDELIDVSYTSDIQTNFTKNLISCIESVKLTYDPTVGVNINGTTCPDMFVPFVVDGMFGEEYPRISFSSSYFATVGEEEGTADLFDIVGKFDKTGGGNGVEGSYDTNYEDLKQHYVDSVLVMDMVLATASASVTTIAMMIHTKSPWLTMMGLVQIILSFPLAFFVYTFVAQLDFFPFLNFIGVFVVFALGADDVFVAVDKWKNTRLHMGSYVTTQEIASTALPDAAGAMFLTTSTTAGAFFATAVCPVAPLTCFAVFCGFLIIFDYLMNVFLVFPALCMYDSWLYGMRATCCTACDRGKVRKSISMRGFEGSGEEEDVDDFMDDDNENVLGSADADGISASNFDNASLPSKPSLIHIILIKYYNFLHLFRWPLLGGCVAAMVFCGINAAQIELPSTSNVALLNEDNEYEKHTVWKYNLLSEVFERNSGGQVDVLWGVKAADTGVKLNPESFTKLVLDETFEPSSTNAQKYMVGFCDRFYATDFAGVPSADYECPMNAFDDWLRDQYGSDSPVEQYVVNCNGAQQLPMSESDFDACIVSWSQLVNNRSILAEKGKVRIIIVKSFTSASWGAPFSELDKEWKRFENFFKNERHNIAPSTCNNMFHTSRDFLWYDTNKQMLNTAQLASLIALVIAASVILLSSRSFLLTLYSVISIGYVLAAAIASLVGLGWELGFLESICFAILIGISCDFVIHFSHAYSSCCGGEDTASNHQRTRYALVHMGPSILAAAITTISAAVVMMFTNVIFFQKFAMVLFMTILHSMVGSFVVFLVLADCFGPRRPTDIIDGIVAWVKKFFG